MSAIGNLIWFIFGGVFMGLSWLFLGVVMAITIVGLPWARACFVIGGFTFFPFGKEVIDRRDLTGRDDLGTGALGLLGNIVWFLFAGVWLAIGHVISAVFSAVTIIGIPFAIQHLKLAGLSLAPIGKTVVSKETALAARMASARIAA